jgi:hypothetical protein
MPKPSKALTVKPPRFDEAKFHIKGITPLVLHRFSEKARQQIKAAREAGSTEGSKRKRSTQSLDAAYESARYRSTEGWDGFQASAIRTALIDACRLIDFKMTHAKMSVFVKADGVDAKEPQIQLIRIHGNPIKQEDSVGLSNSKRGGRQVTLRPAFHDWEAYVTISWDADQFTFNDVLNLLVRVGLQVGIGEGRPNSKKSAGMGWGLFHVLPDVQYRESEKEEEEE